MIEVLTPNRAETLEQFQALSHFNKIFTGHEIRTVFNGNDPWFSARDVCGILGLKNVTKAVLSLDQDEKKFIALKINTKKERVISEPGLYALLFKSRKPEAVQFKDWVFNEVLPTIRKTGAYMTDEVLYKSIEDPDFLKAVVQKLIKSNRKERMMDSGGTEMEMIE